MNLSFAGCGFLGIYHVGVAACFKKYAPHLIVNKVSGASAGAIAACFLLCDAQLGQITSDVLRVITLARAKTLGPFSPSFNIQRVLQEGLMKNLPEDAHLRVNGKLHISMTRVYDHKNVIVSQFNSREDLIQALLCSAFIPIFSGFFPPRFHNVPYMDGGFTNNLPLLDEHTVTVSAFSGESDICPLDDSDHQYYALMCSSFIPFFCGWLPPRFRGIRYMDGCYSDNLPILDENTITVSPFCGESDICPRDSASSLLQINLCNTSIEVSHQNLYRFTRILWPPKPEVLSKMCQQGFDDALRFLHRNNLINCTRCLSVQSTYRLSETLDDSMDYDPDCTECKQQRQEALLDGLPETVVNCLQDAIEATNKGLVNWVFKHNTVKLLSILSLPCIVPADILYATFLKFLEAAPKVRKNIQILGEALVEFLVNIVSKVTPAKLYSAKFTCQLAITEYGDARYDVEAVRELPPRRRPSVMNKVNFGFTLNLDNSAPEAAMENGTCGEGDDTFDRILDAATNHDALMAYYYLDENNQVKVTQIYDVTEADTSAVLSAEERAANAQLEFDGNWPGLIKKAASQWSLQNSLLDMTEGDEIGKPLYGHSPLSSLDLSGDHDGATFCSDPESEWNHRDIPEAFVTPMPSSNPTSISGFQSPGFRSIGNCSPESDRNQMSDSPSPIQRKNSFVIFEDEHS